jgi:hypothetical protein
LGSQENKLNIELTKEFVIKPRRNPIQANDVWDYGTEETFHLQFTVSV